MWRAGGSGASLRLGKKSVGMNTRSFFLNFAACGCVGLVLWLVCRAVCLLSVKGEVVRDLGKGAYVG